MWREQCPQGGHPSRSLKVLGFGGGGLWTHASPSGHTSLETVGERSPEESLAGRGRRLGERTRPFPPRRPGSIPRRTAGQHQHPARAGPQSNTSILRRPAGPPAPRTRTGGARLRFGRIPGSPAASPGGLAGLRKAGQVVRAASPPRRAPWSQGGVSWTSLCAPSSADPTEHKCNPAVGVGPLGEVQATPLRS